VKVLLDTNVLIRWMSGSSLPRAVERLLSKPATTAIVSIVTGWEIAMKPRLEISSKDVEDAVAKIGGALLPIKFKHLEFLSGLPVYGYHKDPFDRMLIAQAFAEELPVVTSDIRFSEYKGLRVVWE
jgi:PIN domain nuclease of toxin-antitoxin system